MKFETCDIFMKNALMSLIKPKLCVQ